MSNLSYIPFLFFNDTAPPEIYTLSLHDALPICHGSGQTRQIKRYRVNVPPGVRNGSRVRLAGKGEPGVRGGEPGRSEEHTSELQSRFDLVCRLLLEKKKETQYHGNNIGDWIEWV